MLFHCINAVRFQNFEVRDNRATDVSCFISCYGCIGDNSIRSNTISCQSFIQKESCIDICQGTHASVTDNTIDHAGTHSISGANFGDDSMGDCAVTISGNRIKESGNTGIYVRDGCIASVENNISITLSPDILQQFYDRLKGRGNTFLLKIVLHVGGDDMYGRTTITKLIYTKIIHQVK